MTLEEIENSLPNGRHDAEVHRLTVDYMQRTFAADVEVWVRNMDDPPQSVRADLMNSVPSNGFFRSFYVREWNTFIHVAALAAKFSWTDDARVRIS